jgi:hypothetical protein
MPDVPFLSEDRKDFNVPPLTSDKRSANASARSASRMSWLINTSGFVRSVGEDGDVAASVTDVI